MTKNKNNIKNFLLELGTEELPQGVLELLEGSFQNLLEKRLQEERIPFSKVSCCFSPRRIVAFIEKLGPVQEDQTVEWMGPSWDRAFDAAGKPTPALDGFMRSKDLKLADLQKKTTPRGDYVTASRRLSGEKTEKVLPKLLENILTGLPFRKPMRWNESRFAFPRPIRWIAALWGEKIFKLEIAGVKAGNFTYGHRVLAPGKIKITGGANLAAFKALLRKRHVIADTEERKQSIREQYFKKTGLKDCDEDLVNETAQLVEEPFVAVGDFGASFLKLPKEILITSLKKHQRIFALKDKKGKMSGKFAAVLNGKRAKLDVIVSDYRGVLEAKLRDALFFFAEDVKTPLEAKTPRLKDVIFLGKLGSLAEKSERLIALAEYAAKQLHLSAEEKTDLQRAAKLCKADLLTQMVYEFPVLQGIMGREYARADGEKEAVCLAIAEHYLPLQLSQDYQELKKQQNKTGALLAILDKVDSLAGAFGTGLIPTGSQDPYALRRAGGGVVKILRAFSFRLNLLDLCAEAVKLYGAKLTQPAENTLRSLQEFFKERIIFEAGVKPGSKEEEILKAALATEWRDVADLVKRYESVLGFSKKEKKIFEQARKVVERTHNILKGAKEQIPDHLDAELCREPLEKKLYDLVRDSSGAVQGFYEQGAFGDLTRLYGESFHGPIDEFFEKILINVEDQAVRKNRQALMKKINRLYVEKVADLSFVSAQV